MGSFGSTSRNQESESRSIPNLKWKYHVFISFSSEDTNFSFISHLYGALRSTGLIVFDDALEDECVFGSGDRILFRAIKESLISIIVFSKNYAGSRRCMQELKEIMECRRDMDQKVVPVFHGVDPSEVRHQQGEFGKAFEVLVKAKKDDVLTAMKDDGVWSYRRWLRQAAEISGFANNSSSEYDLIQNIVKHVTHLLQWTPLHVAEHPVGVETRAQDVIQLFSNSDNVQLLGIWGMGGSGKTTIAKAIYNQINDFDVRRFLPNIRETCDKDNGLVTLQKQLLFGYYQTAEIKTHNIKSGTVSLKERFCREKVLLILDDVNKLEQLDALCGSREWFGPGSRVIITTRDKGLLNKVGADHVYRVKEMDESESIELFSWCAFWEATPKKDFTAISGNVVAYCGGLPLALEVLGAFLFGKNIKDWESSLDRLKIHPHPFLQKMLKISFDGLTDDTEKEIFLDIACFFIGMDQSDVIETLNGSGYSAKIGISVLEERSLLTVDAKNKLRMHLLLRDMGREIVREESQMKLKPMIYDVFLSFRGRDTRATFTSHLHTSLENAGIYVFKDDDALPRGERISMSLLKAIGGSRISIIVLSKEYANSRWCLQELENIMLCYRAKGQMVVPVFYGVDPSEVRKQTGEFGQAFEVLMKRISVEEDKVSSWRTALRAVCDISGFVFIDSRNESKDIKKVVQDVTRLLDRTELFIADHPVGVESNVQQVIELLNKQPSKDVQLLGICGMGGIGKTTLAKAIYNQIGRKFEGRSFLLNIREDWEKDNCKVSLQERLLSDIYKTTKINIRSYESGKIILKERLCQKKVLLVLDDVNKLEQLNALAGSHEWFSPGSCIIITTRDVHLVKVHGVDPVIYRLKEMDESKSLKLFSWHAFKNASPEEDFVGLSTGVVAYCGGLPLALEVLSTLSFRIS